MPGEPQPLASNFQIVNDQGMPTEYFIRWAQERQIDISEGITAGQAQELIDDWAAARDIIAGIGLDGGGNLSADITIDANVQDILDLISSTQGAVLFRGAADWQALAPGTAGDFLKTNGAGADPAWAAGGGGGGGGLVNLNAQFRIPLAADFPTRVSSGAAATFTDDPNNGLLINPGTAVTNYAVHTGVSGDFAVTVRMNPLGDLAQTNLGHGICIYNAAANKTISWCINKTSGSNFTLSAARWTATTFGAFIANTSGTSGLKVFWLRIRVTTGIAYFEYSVDGTEWLTAASYTISGHMTTADGCGLFGFSDNKASRIRVEWYQDPLISPTVKYAGSGGGLTLLASWNGAVDPPISALVAPIGGLTFVEIRAWDVTKAAAGWIGADFSFDGGATYPFAVSDYLAVWPNTGLVPAAGGGGDVRWFLHATAATAARSAYALLWGAGVAGLKKYITTRDLNGAMLNRNAATHLRVAAIISPAVANNNTTFTGGRIEIWGS